MKEVTTMYMIYTVEYGNVCEIWPATFDNLADAKAQIKWLALMGRVARVFKRKG
jgi:hypothetical protein